MIAVVEGSLLWNLVDANRDQRLSVRERTQVVSILAGLDQNKDGNLASLELGGDYWKRFYPPLATTLVENRNRPGYWQHETANYDSVVGIHYTTALAVLSLTPPYQLLPIIQR